MKIKKILTGFIPEARGRDGLLLAVLLARQSGAELTVATIQPPPWPTPGPGRADEGAWRAYLREQAEDSLSEAREIAGPDASYVVHHNKGSGRGLVDLARRQGADLVVIGSAPHGTKGRIALGSTADQLLHASSVPVLLAPRGWGETAPAAFERLTVAYRRGPGCDEATRLAAKAAAQLGVSMRLVTLLIQGGLIRGGNAELETAMVERLRDQADSDLRSAARGQRRRIEVEVEMAEGRTVKEAIDSVAWVDGEMIICASSDSGPLRRVFLGDTSLKIIKAAQRPAMILTRQPGKQ
ncbi:universal stress protein [Nonomuraea sp. NPDC050328]|uniref:universal stress protein n=1 Tax=Nonomuraea sp. NPDC050328 TaxID=3364361 RepID=UPI003796D553